jgi:hypothetical protein
MGPTPPGTGVIKDATSMAEEKWTSPTSRIPDFLEESTHENRLLYRKNSCVPT